MDEFVRVEFSTRRIVRVDGEPAGFTNKVFQVETGHHRFNLGPKLNYRPRERNVDVIGTMPTEPMIIRFTRTDV